MRIFVCGNSNGRNSNTVCSFLKLTAMQLAACFARICSSCTENKRGPVAPLGMGAPGGQTVQELERPRHTRAACREG
jgi:hypothetical protein